ncbi:rab9 effector with kelch motifs [Chlorella sorokiniana]|uniref:Rab9 effector with kelch motifs n=1 Tax=Chlorella sorokiniana TaxID=3076 RepID=A0A2P6U181_CHLSO|nr:rab9 effector with kelch motifs [Chlorella sorokiniana]|eukprot:PRW60075.1 rab9 effector with kelch motifs [Chlorella sorokiniana]
MGNNLSLIASIGVPVGVGSAIGIAIAPEIKGWYRTLKKPSWNPPNWLFGPMWTVLYAAMGYAAHRVWQAGAGPLPLALYGIQLALNFAWSPIFFKLKDLRFASIEITALVGMVVATIWEFSKVDKLAAQLLLPYLGWISFAGALTYNIYLNNPEKPKPASKAPCRAQEGKRVKKAAKEKASAAASALKDAQDAEAAKARQAGEAVHGGASAATATAANVFLAQGGETQGSGVPDEVAEAAAARTAVDSRECWGQEFLVVFGGINAQKEALDDLAVLQCDQEAWFAPDKAAVGPAARAFHAATAIGRKMFMFGGHVYLKAQHKLHQFNDMWCLDTDTWEWSRLSGDSPEQPAPCPRDRASMVAVSPSKLLLVGGADSLNRRLDDCWLFDLEKGAWSEVKVAGAKPRARCCTALFALEQRVLMFGGDTYGVTNELWSLRGLEGEGPAHWTQLQLEGPAPAPRRGHAVAATGPWVVFVGGLTEQRSLMGMKSKSEYLADIAILDRQDRVTWRGVEMASHSPSPREKHTLTALSGGRLLMFGGTDGQTTLGDSWWLDLEHITQQQPDLISLADLADSLSQPLPDTTAAPPLPLPASKQAAAGEGGGVAVEVAAGGSGGGAQQQLAAAGAGGLSPAQLQQAAGAGSALTGGLAYLQQNLPTISSSMTSALTSLRGRLGIPATASAAALAAQQAAASIAEEHDEALLQLGERLLAAAGASGASGSAGLPLDARQLVATARLFFATCSAEQLRLGELPVLMADYRRLARLGWAEVLRVRGPDALADPSLQMPGRYMHLSAEDLRLREVPDVLADYQMLYASHASMAEQAGSGTAAAGGAGSGARPATPAL